MSKKLIRSILSLVLIASFLAPCAIAATETSGAATVTAGALNLRSEPSTGSPVKALIYKGSYLIVTGTKGDWYDVIYDGTQGFVHSDYVDYALTMDGKYGTKGTVSGMSVRLRTEPSLSSQVLGYYNTGARFNVLGISGEWVKVSAEAGLVGYVHSSYINCSSAKNAPVSNYDGTGDALAASAKLYLGTPYVWAGMSPRGFDCSGFLNYIFAGEGYYLYRVAQDIYDYDGVHVDRSQLRVGDIICFGYGPYSITHVGMYIGNGQFIHASSGSGCVVITDLSQNYYSRMYVGAKRVIGQ